ncbi:centrosomal protein of 63 kDa isoform X2 [Ascaphus truei]|uniref:centrosomal protein of 63 kDa isoform X2 n=1 Tax=Ascaphus truei TaxID=8439 RepID=UPI003F59B557
MEALLGAILHQERTGGQQASCEAELQELMRQIDIMVAHKKLEWEAQNHDLTARLELREQELSLVQARLEKLNQEAKAVRLQLQMQEEENHKKTSAHEQQLARFQEELARLKRSYEKVQKRHLRSETKTRGEEERLEVNRLTRRLEEFRQRSLEWEKQRLLYQQQLAGLEAQRKTLTEQIEIFQSQSQSRKQMLEQTSVASRSELQHLSGQLARANDSLCAKEGETERLRLQLEAAIAGQVLLEEKAELKDTLQAQADFLQDSKTQKEELQREFCGVSHALREREHSVRSLEEKLQEMRLSEGRAEGMWSELSVSLRGEQRLQAEVTRLEGSVASVTGQCQQLLKDLAEKRESLHLMEEQHKKCGNAMKKLKGQLSQAELSYNSALDGMRKEISQLTEELHQRDIGISSSNSTAEDMERRHQAEREAAEHGALDNLERENRRLQKELSETQANLDLLQQARQSEIQSTVERRSQEMLESHKQELNVMERQLREVSERYEEEVQTLRSQLDPTSAQRGIGSNNSPESLSSEVWKDDIHEEDSSMESESVQGAEGESVLPHPPSSPAGSIALRFLQEEELRSQDLLQHLDSHIEELKQESQRTVQHFAQPR